MMIHYAVLPALILQIVPMLESVMASEGRLWMRNKICLILSLFLMSSVGLSQTLPVDSDFRSFHNSFIRRLVNQGAYRLLIENSRPYAIGDLEDSLIDIERLSALDLRLSDYVAEAIQSYTRHGDRVSLRLDLNSQGDYREGSAAMSSESFSGHLFWRPNPRFAVVSSFAFDERLADDPTYTGKVWSGFAGRVDYAYMQFDLPYFRVYFGRDKTVWGPGRRGNLLLSGNSNAMDMVKLSGGWGPFHYTTITAVLDPDEITVSYPDTSVSMRINRYLSAHRLEIKPMNMLTLGFSESVIYGGVGRQIEFYYTNPLTWYHGEQLNKNNDDNTFLSFDFSFYPRKGVNLYGEFMVDDFQIEKKSKGDDEPNELGYIGGIYITDPIKNSNLDLSFEYTRINNWTYNQGSAWNRYVYDGKIIGHFLGPDRESIYLSLKRWFLWGGWVQLSYERQNIGVGNVFADWTDPWLFSTGQYEEKFPTGIVEKRDIYGVSVNIFRFQSIQIDLDNFLVGVRNRGNEPHTLETNYEGRLTVSGTFPLL